MHQAIKLVSKENKEHPLVGQYSKKLANLQKKALKINEDPKEMFRRNSLNSSQEVQVKRLSYEEQQKTYEKAKENYKTAIRIMKKNQKPSNSI